MEFLYEFKTKGRVRFGDMRRAQKGDLDACAAVICSSAFDPVLQEWADPEKVLELVDQMTLEEVTDLVNQVAGAMVPKAT